MNIPIQIENEESITNILWIEDRLDPELMRDLLEDGGLSWLDLVHARDLSEGLKSIHHRAFDVILLDLSLPDTQGLKTVKLMQAAAPKIPIVILTGIHDETLAIQAIRIGAQDYLVKTQIDGDLLVRAIRYAIERKRTEEELWKMNEQLKQAHQELKSLDQMKDDFIASVSHELQTPLCSILGYAEALAACEVNSIQHEDFVRIIIDETQRLSRLIENALDFSSLAVGQWNFEFTETNLDPLIVASIRTLERMAAENRIKIEYKPSDVRFVGDVDRIKQVMINLIGNAIKFSPVEGHIRIEVKQEKTHFSVLVFDQGPGIPPQQLDHIFDQFQQINGFQNKSTGLGLAISKNIIEAHHGKIWADSTQNGAVIRFLIPFEQKG